MATDFAAKSTDLDEDIRRELNQRVVNSFLSSSVRSYRGVLPAEIKRTNVDVAIIAGSMTTLDAVKKAFHVPRQVSQKRRNKPYYLTKVRSRELDRDLQVAVTVAGKSLQLPDGNDIRDLLDMYRPRAIFLIGVATQIKGNVDLGDVLMVHAVNRYEPAGSMEPEVQRQPQELVMEEQLQWSMFSYDARSTSYNRRLAVFMSESGDHPRPRDLPKSYSPRVITRDVVAVSGNRVFEDLQFVIEHLHKESDDRVTIADEESYGFASACDGRVWWGIVRGISSIGRPEGKGNAWHYVASGSAAVCLKDFLVEEFLPSGEGEL